MTLETRKPAKAKRNKNRLILPEGASCTEPHVFPENWNTARASLKGHWYVKLNFYDAAGNKKSVTRKNMNDYATLVERQQATRTVIEVMLEDLRAGWNPIKEKKFTPPKIPPTPAQPVGTGPHSTLARALAFAVLKRYKYRKRPTVAEGSNFDRVLIEVRGYVRYFIQTAKTLNLAQKPITDVTRRDVLDTLETIAKNRKWGYASWNNCLAYLSALWKTLIIYDVAKGNPVEGIPDQTPEPAKRVLPTDAQRAAIRAHLEKVAPRFLRAVDIFFASGGRESELCRVQGKDVDLSQQEFTVTVRKGKGGWKRKTKAITDAVLPDWQMAMEDCGPEDYVFSARWKPGKQCNGGEKFNRAWKRHVKIGLGMDVDMYPLKHLHTTLVAAQNEQMAADFNSHADTRMNEKHYDQLSEKRKLDARKRNTLKF